MKTRRTSSRVCAAGICILAAAFALRGAQPAGIAKLQPVIRSSDTARDGVGKGMLSVDDLRVVTSIARRIESMMSLAKGAETAVWPVGVRDPDGALGLYFVCSQPFITPTKTPGMDARKAWLVLAVFAAVKYTEGSPVTVDYIGFTDREGLSGGHWFYKLDMSAARHVQRELFANAITAEQGYDRIISAWCRVTPPAG